MNNFTNIGCMTFLLQLAGHCCRRRYRRGVSPSRPLAEVFTFAWGPFSRSGPTFRGRCRWCGMGTTKDVREAGEAEPGFGPLAGPADIGVTTVGVQVALTGVDAGGACRRLIEVR